MGNNDWKENLRIVYSTNPDFQAGNAQKEEPATLPATQQKLRVQVEKNHRGGKVVTLVRGFVGSEEDLKDLGRLLKTKCGVGGSVKDGVILVQGDLKQKIVGILLAQGYKNTK